MPRGKGSPCTRGSDRARELRSSCVALSEMGRSYWVVPNQRRTGQDKWVGEGRWQECA